MRRPWSEAWRYCNRRTSYDDYPPPKAIYTLSKKILFICLSFLLSLSASAQVKRLATDGIGGTDGGEALGMDEQRGTNRLSWGRDTTSTKGEKEIPIGQFQWKIDPILGDVIPAENNDTVPHLYSNFNRTDGYNGEYNYLGNLGAPRLSRIYLNREAEKAPFLFGTPFSYSLNGLRQLLFTNTLSPITNLSYHSCGTRQNGEDRVRAYFASNINKISGFGFKLDYLYGRGYYNGAQASDFNADLFGYYLGERYQMHAWVGADHQKNAENGGIEDDTYIRDPQSFPQKYGTTDIPVLLDDVYNRNDNQNYHLTHRYNMGFYRELPVPDSLKPKMPNDAELMLALKDSLREVLSTDTLQRTHVLDSLKQRWQSSQVVPTEFVPVSSIIHTLSISRLSHVHYEGRQTPRDYYTYNYYGTSDKVKDRTTGMRIRNTIGLAMREGFKKWVKMGITAYAAHEYKRYGVPAMYYSANAPTGQPGPAGLSQIGVLWDEQLRPLTPDTVGWSSGTEQNFMVGGEISKRDGHLLHYNVNGEICLLGDDIGDFRVVGNGDLNLALGKRDTVSVQALAFIKNETPDFYLRHYHSRNTWWDNDLKQELRTRIEGTLTNKRSRTSIRVGVENVTNYTYLGVEKTLLKGKEETSVNNTDYSHNINAKQNGGNIQVFSATLKQDFKLGPLNWENEVTYQTTSNADVLPLPTINVYSNLYLLFRIAKVLRVELGGDVRYFTNYYAPDYAPSVGQFAVQDASTPRIKCGNYPIVNAYANMHLKHCRIYVAVNHANASTGRMFLAPHYPLNPMTIHWGVSWNFFN